MPAVRDDESDRPSRGRRHPIAGSGFVHLATFASPQWMSVLAPIFPAVPLPMRYAAVKLVSGAGRSPFTLSPKRRRAVASDSVSTTKFVSVGPSASHLGENVG